MKILFVHSATGGFGDKIRIEQILKYLKSSFMVHEAVLPSITFGYVKREGLFKILTSLLPFHEPEPYNLKNPLLNYLDINLKRNFLNRIIRDYNFDIVLAEQFLLGWLVYKILRPNSVPLIVDVHGLSGAEAKGSNDESWYIKEALEAEVFKNCNHLLVVSNEMKKYIVRHFDVHSDKISVVCNGAEPQEFKAKFNFPLKVIYAGAFAYWEQIDDYLDIAQKASSTNFKFYLAGDGSMKKHILKRVKDENIPITYLGYIPRSKMLNVMSKMQVGIAPSTKDLARLVASPIKVLDYMSCGLPVVTPYIGDWGKMIETENCGIALKDDSIENYITALQTLTQSNVWQRKSENGIRAIQIKYNWEQVLTPLKSLMEHIS